MSKQKQTIKSQYEAAHRALLTYELLEYILTLVDSPEAIRQARLVNTFWLTIVDKNKMLYKRWRRNTLKQLTLTVCGDEELRSRDLVDAWCDIGRFCETYDPTLEDSRRKQLRLNGNVCIVDILDLGSVNGEFQAMMECAMAHADAYVLLYSIDSQRSFGAIVEWQQRLDNPEDPIHERIARHYDYSGRRPIPRNPTKPCVVGVIAMNCEVEPENVEVGRSEGTELARRLDCPFFGVSVSLQRNIEESFRDLMQEYADRPYRIEDRKKQEALANAMQAHETPSGKRKVFLRCFSRPPKKD